MAVKIDPKLVADRKKVLAENIKQADKGNVKVAPPTPPTPPVADSTTVADTDTKKAGFMGLPTIAWVVFIGVGVYYAYTKGVFKK